MCGADRIHRIGQTRPCGSSPRVRSRRVAALDDDVGYGIISACAEQTWTIMRSMKTTKDHLRVCGADINPALDHRSELGSSPRVRSRPILFCQMFAADGIISACAEQTAYGSSGQRESWDHLRVCGADHDPAHGVGKIEGSSPRVRSRLNRLNENGSPIRIISACAEQTPLRFPRRM